MIPLFFGPESHRKYGVIHAAVGHGNKGRGIVFCDALFDEAVCSHRTLRFAADSMAEARWNSLRFDYYGTGDSAGDTGEFCIAQAKADINDAVEELKSSMGISAVFLLGLRLGGTLATLVASARNDVRGLVLWDPIINGSTVTDRYAGAVSDDPGNQHVSGFRLPSRVATELSELSIRSALETYDHPLLIVCTSPTDEHQEIASANEHIEFKEFDAPEAWSNTPLGGVRPIPTSVVTVIRQWQGPA